MSTPLNYLYINNQKYRGLGRSIFNEISEEVLGEFQYLLAHPEAAVHLSLSDFMLVFLYLFTIFFNQSDFLFLDEEEQLMVTRWYEEHKTEIEQFKNTYYDASAQQWKGILNLLNASGISEEQYFYFDSTSMALGVSVKDEHYEIFYPKGYQPVEDDYQQFFVPYEMYDTLMEDLKIILHQFVH